MDMLLPTEKWRYMVTTGLWPKKGNFDPLSWMTNFRDEERPLALRLLEGFTYFSEELVKQMFRSAFLNISQHVVENSSSKKLAMKAWSDFVNSVLVVRVTGETPSDTDSGYTFSRLARDILNLDEDRIVAPEIAIDYFLQKKVGNILFVDDFVGSGNQFRDTWQRVYKVSNGYDSFSGLERKTGGGIKYFYCPVICTENGRELISDECPAVHILPAHYFGSQQSALSPDSAIWRSDMRTEGPEFVRVASARAGIPDRDGGDGCWRGFHKLGLALAFSHGYPDATLPLFYHSDNGWKPLLKRGAL